VNKEEAWEHFIDHYGREISKKKIMELEIYFSRQMTDLIPEFLDSFRQLCRKIETMQRLQAKGKIRYIIYSMLRTGIIDRRPVYLIEALNQEWYLDPVECNVKYHPGWAFQFFDQLRTELDDKARLYLNQIDWYQLQRYKLQEAQKYHQYVSSFIRYAMTQAVQLPEFQAIAKEDDFAVRVGEYLGSSVIVYKMERRIEDPTVIKTWLEENNRSAYTCEILTNLNLSYGNYWGINLQYADLRGSNFSQSQMQYCTLNGAKFNRGSLAASDLSEARIYQADFGDCNLQGTNFTEAIGAAGIKDGENWYYPGFRAVNFQGANLEGANFKNAKLRGAIFSGTNLRNVNFEGADLEDAIFSGDGRDSLNLSEAQRRQIIWQE
jgi:hypothetical protein